MKFICYDVLLYDGISGWILPKKEKSPSDIRPHNNRRYFNLKEVYEKTGFSKSHRMNFFLFCFYSTFSPQKRSDDDRAEKYITNLRERNKFCKCLIFLENLEQELKSVFLCQNYATSEINKKKLCMLLARM